MPHVLAPHLLWVVTSLLCAAVSGRLLAESLEAEDPTEESVWLDGDESKRPITVAENATGPAARNEPVARKKTGTMAQTD